MHRMLIIANTERKEQNGYNNVEKTHRKDANTSVTLNTPLINFSVCGKQKTFATELIYDW